VRSRKDEWKKNTDNRLLRALFRTISFIWRPSAAWHIAGSIRPQDNRIIVGSAFKIASELGWYPEIPLKRTLKDMIDYFEQAGNYA
jgi:nucleoside-diphosphate-sugar epimerase